MSATHLASVEVTIPSNPTNQQPIPLHPAAHNASATVSKPADIVDENNGPFAEVVTTQQAWNNPRINIWRVAATFFGFFLQGANEASYGPLVPSIEKYFSLNYTLISLIFIFPFVGYILAAFLSDRIHMLLGQRGVAIIGTSSRLISYIVLSVRPPYPVVLVFLVSAGFGNGLLDAAWNAFVGDLANANQILGIIHAFYGFGATVAPIIATSMVTRYGLKWNTFFFVMVGLAAVDLALSAFAFWDANGAEYRKYNANSNAAGVRMRAALSNKVTWICSFFLLAYVGSEVSIGGWLVVFMLRVRGGDPFASGMTATGFWLGITIGRVVLGFVTPRFGERISVIIYLILAMGLELLFWLVPQFYVSAVAVGLVGLFLGPLFPASIVAATKILPKRMHVSSIGFAAALGGSGAAVIPFAVGAIAQAKGVQVLQPVILALLVIQLGLWLTLPKIPKSHAE